MNKINATVQLYNREEEAKKIHFEVSFLQNTRKTKEMIK